MKFIAILFILTSIPLTAKAADTYTKIDDNRFRVEKQATETHEFSVENLKRMRTNYQAEIDKIDLMLAEAKNIGIKTE